MAFVDWAAHMLTRATQMGVLVSQHATLDTAWSAFAICGLAFRIGRTYIAAISLSTCALFTLRFWVNIRFAGSVLCGAIYWATPALDARVCVCACASLVN